MWCQWWACAHHNITINCWLKNENTKTERGRKYSAFPFNERRDRGRFSKCFPLDRNMFACQTRIYHMLRRRTSGGVPDFHITHRIWLYKGLMCLSTSGNYTQVEILTGNSWEKFINYKVLRQESNLRLCDAGTLLWPLSYGGSWQEQA